MPVANAVSAARIAGDVLPTRPSGRPRKIVKPAIAPRRRVWVGAHVRRHLTEIVEDYDRQTMATGHGIDEYLETIYFLAFPIGEYRPAATGTTQTIAVARRRDARRLARLGRRDAEAARGRGARRARRAQGGDPHRRPAPSARAKVVRKHRIIERLLTDFMGYTAAEAHVHADELGGTFSDDMVERIDEKLGHPERCPHGWPVDPDVEQAENRELEPLSALEPGARATIVRLAEHDGDLLHWFYDQGLVPGTVVELRARRARRRPVRVARRRRREGDRREGRRRRLVRARAVGR